MYEMLVGWIWFGAISCYKYCTGLSTLCTYFCGVKKKKVLSPTEFKTLIKIKLGNCDY